VRDSHSKGKKVILGHQKQWKFLKKLAEAGKLPHAFLFSGQDQLGKKTLAIEFIKFLNCRSIKKPCQVCRSCQDIQKGIYPDSILVKPDPSRKEIQISQIRNLIKELSLCSYSSSFKTAILDKSHLMSREAQNCFLKFLEEPKGRTLLILITEYPQLLLPTILSRVQKLNFFPVKDADIENYLVAQGLSKEKAEHFSSFSFGKPGMAFNFLLDSQKLKNQEKLISDLVKISNSDLAFRFRYAKNLSEKDADVKAKEVLDTWLRYFRKVFLSRLVRKEKAEIFNQYSLSKMKEIIKLIQSTSFLISTTNVNSRLALEMLLISL